MDHLQTQTRKPLLLGPGLGRLWPAHDSLLHLFLYNNWDLGTAIQLDILLSRLPCDRQWPYYPIRAKA